jgi:3-phosphoshikimate 1-carboxyvinyltransferase
VGNSGTTLYLAAAVSTLAEGITVFTGDEQIRRRSAGNLLGSLEDLGAYARSTRANGCAPLILRGPLRGGKTGIACPTSQYLSALLLACPLATSVTSIDVPLLNERPYVDMTLWWLDSQGIEYTRERYSRFRLAGRQSYRPFREQLPGDYSSASFLFCAAAITGGSVTLTGLDPADPQGDKGVLDILETLGCEVRWADKTVTLTGPGAAGGTLHGGSFDLNAMPDALPALAATGCFCDGELSLTNVAQARRKETDRIAVMTELLRSLGADVRELPDGIVVVGGGRKLNAHEAVRGYGDHRVVMALALAGLGSATGVTISDAEAAAVTFPSFFTTLKSLRVDS